ncbi:MULTISPECIES: DegT/DnrJ/EryC1/StrS family aminotransferase [unclassified Streptomyces]|uniref:DegT/DnrJ/EryC1/StrS family aminotransferase n=1 Tax=unclassified Streptomyces TaxID=2593676 RepID=UPI00068F2C1C|nr:MULTISPECIES: DegT/DnrJ/EryC1/StrS family aminotransferase [unclassified Streptomyces]
MYERRFAEEFARYLGARRCVPVDHGSSALIIALEALGIEHGSEVIVPALTWTATATAVFRAGLVPVLADVDPATGCLTPETVDAARTSSTRAVIVVHWACVMADVPAIGAAVAPHGIAIVEDAAQAHGAAWEGRRAGTLGDFGCFSMQHAKVLTCGEGGALVTDRVELVQRLEELRADSRSHRARPLPGQLELAETASVMGANFGIDELSAALLCAQLEILPEQHARRNANYHLLERLLEDIDGVSPLRRDPRQDELSLYEVPLVFHDSAWPNARIAEEMSRELGVRVYTPREPLDRSPLLRPDSKPGLRPLAERFNRRNAGRRFPGAAHLSSSAVLLHHSAFLGGEDSMHALGDAVRALAARVRRT